MNTHFFQTIAKIRLLIGFLGEKQQFNWWGSSFISPASKSFLEHLYPRSVSLAQYSGVCQAAARIHDEFIGLGNHYHLYRLPDSLETKLSKVIQDNEFSEFITSFQSSKENALKLLSTFTELTVTPSEGPVIIGDYSDASLPSTVPIVAAHYMMAFNSNIKTFPYIRC